MVFHDAHLGTVLGLASFYAVWSNSVRHPISYRQRNGQCVTVDNNRRSLSKFNDPNASNFDQWIKTQSPKKNVENYISAPADPRTITRHSEASCFRMLLGLMVDEAL